MNRTPEEAALILAVLFQRSGEKRARISEKTLKLIGYRERLKAAFIVNVTEALADYHDLCLIQISNGFGIIPNKSLEAAKAITAKKILTKEELDSLRNGEDLDFESLRREIENKDEFMDDSD